MPNGNRRSGVRSGFTLIELLVVIGIILVLLGILLPVANKIIVAAHKTDTAAQITKLATAIQFYYTTNGAYPGPIPDSSIWGYNTRAHAGQQLNLPVPEPSSNCVFDLGPPGKIMPDITSSENLVLGLVGGLKFDTTQLPNVSYDVNQIANGNGPRGMNPLAPQQFPAYVDFVKAEMSQDPSTGVFASWAQTNQQKDVKAMPVIPEFVDHFPNPHPIIYLCARVGAANVADVVINPASSPTGSPWYSMEMAPYWTNWTTTDASSLPTVVSNGGVNAPFPSTPIGPIVSGGPAPQPLWTDEISFFQNQTLKDNITPRSNGSFILISAGADGIYGTPDDIIYSN